jgi:hypothetical protein
MLAGSGQLGLGLLAPLRGALEYAGAVPRSLGELAAEPVPARRAARRSRAGARRGAWVSIARRWLPSLLSARLSWAKASLHSTSGKSSSPAASCGSGPTNAYRQVSYHARESCTLNQFTSSPPVTHTRARHWVSPCARCPVVA